MYEFFYDPMKEIYGDNANCAAYKQIVPLYTSKLMTCLKKLSSIGNWGYRGNFKPVFFRERF